MKKQMQSIKSLVYKMLKTFEHHRDDDNKLIAYIWHSQCPEYINTKDQFILYLSSGKLSSPESIRRMRQKLQEEYPELRGSKYKIRHKVEKEVRNYVKI